MSTKDKLLEELHTETMSLMKSIPLPGWNLTHNEHAFYSSLSFDEFISPADLCLMIALKRPAKYGDSSAPSIADLYSMKYRINDKLARKGALVTIHSFKGNYSLRSVHADKHALDDLSNEDLKSVISQLKEAKKLYFPRSGYQFTALEEDIYRLFSEGKMVIVDTLLKTITSHTQREKYMDATRAVLGVHLHRMRKRMREAGSEECIVTIRGDTSAAKGYILINKETGTSANGVSPNSFDL
jgi:hypothetical protein